MNVYGHGPLPDSVNLSCANGFYPTTRISRHDLVKSLALLTRVMGRATPQRPAGQLIMASNHGKLNNPYTFV